MAVERAQRLLTGEPIPRPPVVKDPEIDFWVRNLYDYLRRLMGWLSRADFYKEIIKFDMSNLVFWAKITDYRLQDGSTNIWEYQWTEVKRVATGWQVLSEGRTSDGWNKPALNSVEANNDGTGVEGGGVNVDDLPGTFALQPIKGEPVVQMIVDYKTDGTAMYSFVGWNTVDGACE